MPSASSTVAVVESQPRGDRCHGGPRSLKGESPFVNAYQRVEPPSRPVWRKDNPSITSSVRLAHNASIRLLARDGRTMPSASSTVAVVESQRRGDRGHGGLLTLKEESPFACISGGGATLSPCLAQKKPLESSLPYAWPTLRLYARWLTTAVSCRQRAAQSPLWRHNGGVTAATVGRRRSRGSRPSYAYRRVEPPSRLVWRKRNP